MTKESELHQSTGLFTQLVNPQTGETVTFHFEAGQSLPIDVVMPDRTARARLRVEVDPEASEYDVRLVIEYLTVVPTSRTVGKSTYLSREPSLVSAQLAKDPESAATATGSHVAGPSGYLPRESKLISEQLAKDPGSPGVALGSMGLPQAPPPPTREQNPYSVFAPMETPKNEPTPTGLATPGGEEHPQSVFGPGTTAPPTPTEGATEAPPEPQEGSGAADQGAEGKVEEKAVVAPAKAPAATPAKGPGGRAKT